MAPRITIVDAFPTTIPWLQSQDKKWQAHIDSDVVWIYRKRRMYRHIDGKYKPVVEIEKAPLAEYDSRDHAFIREVYRTIDQIHDLAQQEYLRAAP